VSFLTNDLSFHGQFQNIVTFSNAIGRLMAIREIARRFGRELHCHRGLANALVMPNMTMPQAILGLSQSQQRALRSWFTKTGPFWEDTRSHGPDDYLELNGAVVTDTAVGEAAWCRLIGIDRELVSVAPSNWQFSPLSVEHLNGGNTPTTVEVENHWDPGALENALENAPVPMATWRQLETLAKARFPLLTIATHAFTALDGHPFVPGAAQRLLSIMGILNQFKSCFEADGQRTKEGHEIYQNFFTGAKEGGGHGATFSDSSDSEKEEFKTKLTFRQPDDANKSMFCTWHGKVQTPQIRVHFSWPVRANEPLYVVYVGPKLTKR